MIGAINLTGWMRVKVESREWDGIWGKGHDHACGGQNSVFETRDAGGGWCTDGVGSGRVPIKPGGDRYNFHTIEVEDAAVAEGPRLAFIVQAWANADMTEAPPARNQALYSQGREHLVG